MGRSHAITFQFFRTAYRIAPEPKAETDHKCEDIDDRESKKRIREHQKSEGIELPFLSVPLQVSTDNPPQTGCNKEVGKEETDEGHAPENQCQGEEDHGDGKKDECYNGDYYCGKTELNP